MKTYTVNSIENGELNGLLGELYGPEAAGEQKQRYSSLIAGFTRRFGSGEVILFSSPGRSELCGNHTDHNHGKVIAAGIQLDKIAAAVPRSDFVVEIVTEGFPEDISADLRHLKPDSGESGKADALVRGIAAYFQQKGYRIGGFSAYIDSRVAMGSGLSSSASLEVLIGMVFNTFYNGGTIDEVELARAGKFAENTFFHKPCGLMDQVACAAGGISVIDFKEENDPKIDRIDISFNEFGYQLMILDTGGDHADLTGEYAAIPREMGCIAGQFDRTVLRDCSLEEILRNSRQLRETCGDRAVLRAIHFYQENERVDAIREALAYRDINAYLRTIEASGISSWTLLQNCTPGGASNRQAVTYALGFLRTICPNGIFRVHGGGFAGTVQGYIPEDTFDTMQAVMEAHFGKGSATPLTIRSRGVIHIGEE